MQIQFIQGKTFYISKKNFRMKKIFAWLKKKMNKISKIPFKTPYELCHRGIIEILAFEHRSPVNENGKTLDSIYRGAVLLEWTIS